MKVLVLRRLLFVDLVKDFKVIKVFMVLQVEVLHQKDFKVIKELKEVKGYKDIEVWMVSKVLKDLQDIKDWLHLVKDIKVYRVFKVTWDSKGKDIFGYQVLEGQQRLITTLFPFLNDEWTLHGSVEPVEVDGFTYDIAGKKYSELEEELQDIIKNYRFTVQAIENYTMEEAEKLYFNINSGVALSAMQKGKA